MSWTGSGVDSQEISVKFVCEKCGYENDTIAYETRWRDCAIAECDKCGEEKTFEPQEPEDYETGGEE